MAGTDNLKPILDSQRARELQKKSVEKRLENIEKKKMFESMIRERLKDEDLQEIIDNLIKRSKSNDKSLEVLRDTVGEKPTDKQQVESENTNINMSYEEYLKKVSDSDGY